MKKNIGLILLVSIIFLISNNSLNLFGQNLKTNENMQDKSKKENILKGLAEKYKSLQTLKADYRRTTANAKNDEVFKKSTQTAEGLLLWSKPTKLKLEQKKPQAEDLITNGETVWWHIKNDKIAYVYDGIDIAAELRPFLSFLSGLETLNSQFKVSLIKEFSAEFPQASGLLLEPFKTTTGDLTKINVWCDTTYNLVGFQLKAVTGEVTTFNLSNLKINDNIRDSVFNFKPPRGVEIIKEN